MSQINSILATPTLKINNYYAPAFKAERRAEANVDNKELLTNSLQASAVANAPLVKKVELTDEPQNFEYKNNLRTMIQNNESVMLAIAPRTFTAKDLNGDEKISLHPAVHICRCRHAVGGFAGIVVRRSADFSELCSAAGLGEDIFFLYDPQQSNRLFHVAQNMGSLLHRLHKYSCTLATALGNIIFRHVCGDYPSQQKNR